jgi:hypothetical protein
MIRTDVIFSEVMLMVEDIVEICKSEIMDSWSCPCVGTIPIGVHGLTIWKHN